MLTVTQIDAIKEIIKRRINLFIFDVLGPTELTREEVRALEQLGVLYGSGKSLVHDSYVLGTIASLLGENFFDTNSEVIEQMINVSPPLTEIEEQSVRYAENSVGQLIKNIGSTIVNDATALSSIAAAGELRMLQEDVSESIANRETTNQLRTRLYAAFDNRQKDWDRVAFTEIHNATQNGVYNNIKENSEHGANQLVYKQPNPDACKYCNALYLKEDGVTPRVYKLKDLFDNNYGLKASSWNPVIGSTHPWCGCALMFISDGFDFVNVKRVSEPFEHDGQKYTPGMIVPENELEEVEEDNSDKLKDSVSLMHTGSTAKPETRKSMSNIYTDVEDEPICGLC